MPVGRATAYSPQAGGSTMEGGYESSRRGLDGQRVVRTLDDYASGQSGYVTVAGDPSFYGNRYTIPSITYTDAYGNERTLTNVPAYVHDTGAAFKGEPEGRFDIAVGRDYSSKSLNRQPFSGMSLSFVPGWDQAAALAKSAYNGTLGDTFDPNSFGFGTRLDLSKMAMDGTEALANAGQRLSRWAGWDGETTDGAPISPVSVSALGGYSPIDSPLPQARPDISAISAGVPAGYETMRADGRYQVGPSIRSEVESWGGPSIIGYEGQSVPENSALGTQISNRVDTAFNVVGNPAGWAENPSDLPESRAPMVLAAVPTIATPSFDDTFGSFSSIPQGDYAGSLASTFGLIDGIAGLPEAVDVNARVASAFDAVAGMPSFSVAPQKQRRVSVAGAIPTVMEGTMTGLPSNAFAAGLAAPIRNQINADFASGKIGAPPAGTAYGYTTFGGYQAIPTQALSSDKYGASFTGPGILGALGFSGGGGGSSNTQTGSNGMNSGSGIGGALGGIGAAIGGALGLSNAGPNNANSADGGSGGGGGSSRVICTHFYRKGWLPRDLWRADLEWTINHLSPATVRGYHVWAIPYVRLMRRSKFAESIMWPIAKYRAIEIAHLCGVRPKGSFVGKIIRATIEPMCYIIGVFVGESRLERLYSETD